MDSTYDNPIQGATAVVQKQPDVILLDVEMPYVDGEYLVDWIKPQLDAMPVRPKVVVISSLKEPPKELLSQCEGFVHKYSITDVDTFESRLKSILL